MQSELMLPRAFAVDLAASTTLGQGSGCDIVRRHCCNAGEQEGDMVLLGGAMFAAFYEEECQLFDAVDLRDPAWGRVERIY